MSQKKLLIIDPAHSPGGAEDYVLTVGRAAKGKGWSVSAAFNTVSGMESFADALTNDGIQVHHLDIDCVDSNIRSLPAHLSIAMATRQLLKKVDPDVVQLVVPWPGNALGVLLGLAVRSIPGLIVYQLVPDKRTDYRWLVNRLYRWSMSRGQQWVAVSNGNRKILTESFGVPETEIRVIHNGADVSSADDLSPEARMRERRSLLQELGLGEETRLILSVARLEERKGYLDIVAAAPEIVRQEPYATFVWAGSGELETELKTRIRALGLDRHFFMLGYREDIPRLHAACDLFLFPSHFEGFPFALLEAMAGGIPYVASDSCGSEEIGTHEEYGLHFPSGSPELLAATVLQALNDPGGMRQRSRKALARSADFSTEAMIDKTLSSLESLVR